MKKYLLFILAIGLVGAGFYFISQQAQKEIIRKVKLRDVASDLLNFTLQYGNAETPIAFLNCQSDAGCQQGTTPQFSTLSSHVIWPMPKSAVVSDSYEKVKNNILEGGDTFAEQTNYELFYSALRTEDEDIFNLFYDNVVRNQILFQYPAILEDLQTNSTMYATQLVLPIALVLRSFEMPVTSVPGIREHIVNNPFASNIDYQPATVKDRAPKILSDVFKILSKTQTSSPDYTLFPNEAIPVDACWAFWLVSESYLATKDPQYKNYIDGMRHSFAFSQRKTSEIHYEVLQNILPCLQAFEDLKSDAFYGDILSSDIKFLTGVILDNYDSKLRPICASTGGLLSLQPNQNESRCDGVDQSVADAAWASYLFADKNEEYSLE